MKATLTLLSISLLLSCLSASTCAWKTTSACFDTSSMCEWYGKHTDCYWCDTFNHATVSSRRAVIPTQACCACGGGLYYGLQPSCNVMDLDKFNICLDLGSVSGEYETWMNSVAPAKATWEHVIKGDLGDPKNSSTIYTPIVFIGKQPNFPLLIDDVYIAVADADMDGPGGILGMATRWCCRYMEGKINPLTNNPYVVSMTGIIVLDIDDIDGMVNSGVLPDIVTHEFGHILGFGSLWGRNGLYQEGSGVYASNTRAEQEWNAIGCDGPLPIELDGGNGAVGAHWDEACLRKELMTGYKGSPEESMSLSRITLGAFEDIGYEQVDYSQADPFTTADLGDCGSSCPGSQRLRRVTTRSNHQSSALNTDTRKYISSFAVSLGSSFRHLLDSADAPEGVEYDGQVVDVIYQDDDGGIRIVEISMNDIDVGGM